MGNSRKINGLAPWELRFFRGLQHKFFGVPTTENESKMLTKGWVGIKYQDGQPLVGTGRVGMDKILNRTQKQETKGSLESFKTFLDYDPVDGKLTYKDTRFGNKKVGQVAGYVDRGYLRLWSMGRLWFCHRVAWALYYGKWPGNTVDHINGDKKDNRINNLRVCTNSENMMNRKPYSGKIFKGVYKRNGITWEVFLGSNGKQNYCGSYKCLGQALKAYDAKAKELHGEYARLNLPTLDNP